MKAWGGPPEDKQYVWPSSNHGISIDNKNNVWIGGNGGRGDAGSDSHILKFTHDGKFLMQIGEPGQPTNSNSTTHFGRVAKISFDYKANEAFIADGYGNRRVAVLDMNDGKIKRFWGAYGKTPSDSALPAVRAGPAAAAVPQSRALRRADAGRSGLRLRPRERPHPGVPEERRVREGEDHQAADEGRRLGVGHRLLAGPAAEVHLPRRRQERARVRHGPAVTRDHHRVRRRRPPAGPVVRRAQHRDRLEGQHLHDRDVRRKANSEVRIQRNGDSRAETRASSGPNGERDSLVLPAAPPTPSGINS